MKLSAAFFGLSSLMMVAASNVVELHRNNIDAEVIGTGVPTLVKFYTPWCGHCKKLAPTWQQLADIYAPNKGQVKIAEMDCDKSPKTCDQFGIKGYPTMKYFDGHSDVPVEYDGKRDIGALQAFINERTSIKPKVKKDLPSEVAVLNDSNFDSVVNGEKNVLVEFYAPWCGHCKNLAPIYETLAKTFSREPDVVIAKVDADAPNGKASARKYGVTGFPTLKFFPKGSTEAVPYSSGRNEAAFVDFLNENAGTFRSPGGGLNEKAGLIPAFAEVLQKLVKGDVSSLGKVTAEIVKLAEKAVEASAPVYVKALEKLAANGDYLEKEIQRLQKLLAKGGLSPEKIDQFTIKKNILNSIKAAMEKVETKVGETVEKVEEKVEGKDEL